MKEEALAGHPQAIKIGGVRQSSHSLSKSPPKHSVGISTSPTNPPHHFKAQAVGPAKPHSNTNELNDKKEVEVVVGSVGEDYPRPN